MELNNKRVLVVGMGKSGVSAALFLKSKRARVTVSDSRGEEQLSKELPALLDNGVIVETGGHGERTFRDQDLIVVSPGVPVDAPQLQQARALDIPIIGEVELASRFLRGKIVAVTGSNGKTTTTALVGEILQKSGKKAQVGGNIGRPVTDMITGADDDTWSVLEISSFQLETVGDFRAHIAAILNITPDHLDRHGTFEIYSAMKARIFENQTKEDFAVLNADDPTCVKIGDGLNSTVSWFGQRERISQGAFPRAGHIYFRDGKNEIEIMPVKEIALKGAHNLENVLAAVCIAILAGCVPADIRKAVSEFKAVEHRLEFVANVGGVSYYNDSKATNVDATIKALESFATGIHIILGGKDKNSDYSLLLPLLKARARQVYTIGAAAEKIESQLGDMPLSHAGTLERAVQVAAHNAAQGDVVLLAPACASFDQFQSYEHRGRTFKELVRKLQAEAAGQGRG